MTTEKDVEKGNTRMPLELARMYNEDIIKESAIANKMKDMKIDEDDLLANIENR